MLKKSFLFLLCCCIANFLLCQELDGDVINTKINVSLRKKEKANAIKLVEQLAKSTTSDKDKFDAIFTWVAKNIKYNYNAFYLPTNSGPKEITRILKRRSTICLGYAQLMDTLCNLAGIQNVTVFGYAKDEFYDVNDTIFSHNHAWNAVKLDGLWYVYDVTWSNGKTGFRLTKKAKIIEWLLNKFPEKYKKKKIKVPRKYRFKTFCGDKKMNAGFYYKRRLLRTLLRLRLMMIPVKTVQTYFKGISKDYYLSNPELFSARHVPDNPVWSLLDRNKSTQFEKDSLFYYLNDSLYHIQERKGVVCEACDSIYNLSFQERLIDLNNRTRAFNKNNTFINTYCEEELGRHLFYKSLIKDTTRTAIADSAVLHFNMAVADVIQSRKNMAKFFKYGKLKNDTKAKLLLKDNKSHESFIKNKVKITIEETKYTHEVVNKTSAFASNYLRTRHQFKNFRTHYNFDNVKPYSDSKITALEKIHDKKTQTLDSIILTINQQQNQFDSVITHLSLNIYPQVFTHDSILIPFKKCIRLRLFLKDNYKKEIVDLRKSIYPMEYKYTQEIDKILYEPLQETRKLFKSITNGIKLKQALESELLKLKVELYKTKAYSEPQIESFRDNYAKETEYDFCWLRSSYPKLLTTVNGLYTLKNKQNYVLYIIAKENEIEKKRQSYINKQLKLGYRYTNEQIANDTKLLNKKLKNTTKYAAEIKNKEAFNKKRYDRLLVILEKLFEKK